MWLKRYLDRKRWFQVPENDVEIDLFTFSDDWKLLLENCKEGLTVNTKFAHFRYIPIEEELSWVEENKDD